MNLFDQTTFECSKIITTRYSTSFTLGIKTLGKEFHFPVYAIYGFVRYADEIVDTFYDHDQRVLLARFRQDTYEAIENRISLNPVLHAFQLVVNEYGIDHKLIDAFLSSMEMDLTKTTYDEGNYEKYIYGSAEVVGLMCLKVFCRGDDAQYRQLEQPARRLGAAFQKVNFLRDIRSDFRERGRVYFPGVEMREFNDHLKRTIESDVEKDFAAALSGIRNLPDGSRLGVYLAYIYYIKLFNKIRRAPAQRILNGRIRIPNIRKFLLLFSSYIKYRIRVI
jgi:phytoene/squalene synthetase